MDFADNHALLLFPARCMKHPEKRQADAITAAADMDQ
jgi:hypothetical protein